MSAKAKYGGGVIQMRTRDWRLCPVQTSTSESGTYSYFNTVLKVMWRFIPIADRVGKTWMGMRGPKYIIIAEILNES